MITCPACWGTYPDWRIECDWCQHPKGAPISEEQIRKYHRPVGEIGYVFRLPTEETVGKLWHLLLWNHEDWPEHENWKRDS